MPGKLWVVFTALEVFTRIELALFAFRQRVSRRGKESHSLPNLPIVYFTDMYVLLANQGPEIHWSQSRERHKRTCQQLNQNRLLLKRWRLIKETISQQSAVAVRCVICDCQQDRAARQVLVRFDFISIIRREYILLWEERDKLG